MRKLSLEISGNLLSETILDILSEEKSAHAYAKPETFKWHGYDIVDSQSIHLSRIAEAYEKLTARWDMLASQMEGFDISTLRDRWIKFLFDQFGYNLEYQKADVLADSGNRFYLSHRGWSGDFAPIVHTVLSNQDLESKPADGRHKYSPHDTLQRYLNQVKEEAWGIVTNGKELRLLRDFHHETRQAYIKFDLEAIFEGRNYSDFRLLWRLIHPSRFVPDENGSCILEYLFEESKNAGVAIGENLQKNVRLAIETLANGFLLATPGVADRLMDNNKESMHFYQQLLRVIYRFLFLFYAEQRKLMPTHSSLYAQEYSMTSLRDKVEEHYNIDAEKTDFWEGVKVTFKMVYHGVPDLGISAFNGQLFDPKHIELLDSAQCRNDKLLETVQYMSVFDKDGLLFRISYTELSVDEIGAIYESLLEYIPRVSSKEEIFEDSVMTSRRNRQRTIPPRTFFLDPRGTSRKTSGSYYTNPELVNALIDSAVKPVLEKKLADAGSASEQKEKALLSMKICDCACGSAAFLIAATEYLGEVLAKIRTTSDYPSDDAIRHARRDVLRHCIYGVDINPMSVELAKVSLWLTVATGDQPLNFLDHKIKCGNSLIGATPELIKKGIPPEAYVPIEIDDTETARQRVKSAKEYYKDKEQKQLLLNLAKEAYDPGDINDEDLSNMFDETSAEELREIEETYLERMANSVFINNKLLFDYWTAAFFWKHVDKKEKYPDPDTLDLLLDTGMQKIDKKLKSQIAKLAEDYKFFHWHLEFPEVFSEDGFDCVIGNPPWDVIQPEEKQYFATIAPDIANLSGNKRKKAINDLEKKDYRLWQLWKTHIENHELLCKYIKKSGRFTLTAIGKLNTYSLFSELAASIINKKGMIGVVVPTGICTDNGCREFFSHIVKNNLLKSLYDFENREGLFPSVHRMTKFCLLTITNKKSDVPEFAFFLKNVSYLDNKFCKFTLEPRDIELINPNTRTMPIFRTNKDAELTKKIYKAIPVLINKQQNTNPWCISFRQGLFNMTSDSHLFHEKYNKGKVPLYESKMIWQFDHRFGTYAGYDYNSGSTHLPKPTLAQYQDFDFKITPRYWVDDKEVEKKVPHDYSKNWFIGFRDITNAMNERTAIFSILPKVGVGNNLPLLFPQTSNSKLLSCLLANVNSIIFDYVVRQKISGTHMNFFFVEQFPVLDPKNYEKKDIDFIVSRVLELVYTSTDLECFAKDMGYAGEPFIWDAQRREQIIAELDAYFFHLYSLSDNEVKYVLDPSDVYSNKFPGETFGVLKRKEIIKYNEYRTKKLVLKKYEELKSIFS